MPWDKPLPKRPVVAVAGATGAVGREMLTILEQRAFPYSEVRALASARSAGNTIPFGEGEIVVEEMGPDSFGGVDIALFSAGGDISKAMREAVTSAGAIMIDNSSAFRMEEGVPLVVPEVNAHALAEHSGVIANPNCSTIQLVVALKPIHDLLGIKRVVVSTYQAASGAGAGGMNELYEQTREFLDGQELTIEHFIHQIAFNCIPQIDVFMSDGSTKEEWKMVVETKKILGDDNVSVAANCVRVPVLRCHSEMVNVECNDEVDMGEIRHVLATSPGIAILDDPAAHLYPMPAKLAGSDLTYIGRLRKDESAPDAFSMWVVADQLRKGAALNTVQIAEALLGL